MPRHKVSVTPAQWMYENRVAWAQQAGKSEAMPWGYFQQGNHRTGAIADKPTADSVD